VDGIFEMMLLLKKKKYAALVVSGEEGGKATAWSRETKGLDLVRRDWCPLSRNVGSRVLDLLLSAKPRDEVRRRRRTRRRTRLRDCARAAMAQAGFAGRGRRDGVCAGRRRWWWEGMRCCASAPVARALIGRALRPCRRPHVAITAAAFQ
jgi:hypothetical protein